MGSKSKSKSNMERLKRYYCNPKVLFLFILVIGLAILLFSFKIPKYIATNEYKKLNEEFFNETISREKYLNEFEEKNKVRNSITDIGNGLITFSFCVLVFLSIQKINHWDDFLKLKAKKRVFLFCISNFMLILLIPGTYIYYLYRGWRGDYPPVADSIGVPIYYNTLFYLHCIIPLNLFLLLALSKSNLQTYLYIKTAKYNWIVVVWECVFIIFILLLLIILFFSIIDGDHATIIGCLSFIYIVVSLRAGKMNYYRNKLQSL